MAGAGAALAIFLAVSLLPSTLIGFAQLHPSRAIELLITRLEVVTYVASTVLALVAAVRGWHRPFCVGYATLGSCLSLLLSSCWSGYPGASL